MTSENLDVFMPVLILIVIAIVMVLGAFLVSSIIAPKSKDKNKDIPYECGEEPVGPAWSLFNIRFYVVALIFIIFDVESVLMFPVAAVFKKFTEIGEGTVVFVIFLLFISILVEGIVYCWKKGDFDWVKSYRRAETKRDSK